MPVLLSKNVDLTKKVMAKVNLRKDKKCDVILVIDTSGSMAHLISNGTVEEAISAVFSVAFMLDDNAELDVFSFSNDFEECDAMYEPDYGKYVQTVFTSS